MSSRWTFWCLIWLFISYGGLPTESWRTRGAPQTEASAYARQDTPARSNRWGGLGQTRWCAGCHTGAAKAPLFLPTAGSGGSHQGTQHVVAVSTLLAVGEGHCGFLPTVRNWPPELCRLDRKQVSTTAPGGMGADRNPREPSRRGLVARVEATAKARLRARQKARRAPRTKGPLPR